MKFCQPSICESQILNCDITNIISISSHMAHGSDTAPSHYEWMNEWIFEYNIWSVYHVHWKHT